MNDPDTHPHTPACGFTLIEVAVVLFIASLFLGGIATMVNSLMISQQVSSTKTKEDAIKAALANFIVRNYRLPCPAVATLAEGAANNGVEASTAGTCTGTTISGAGLNQIAVGVVPWASLGLSSEAALDSYANRFTYQVALAATNLNSTTISGMTGNMTTHSAGFGVLGAAPTGNQLNDCSGGASTNPCALVTAVVSHGKDGYGAYTRSGSQIPFPATVTGNDARENANADSKLVIKDYSGVDSNPFDDIVLGITASDLLTPLVMAGTIKDYRATLNATFAVMQAAVTAYAASNPSGYPGSRSYALPNPSTLYGSAPNYTGGLLALSQITDPWGTAIIYTKYQNYISSGDSPSSTAFTLQSYGPDKSSASSDNITLTVTAGDMQNILQLSGW